MKKIIIILMLVLVVVVVVFLTCCGKNEEKEIEIDYSEYLFTDVIWTRDSGYDIETIIFSFVNLLNSFFNFSISSPPCPITTPGLAV